MADVNDISIEAFRALVERTGMRLDDEELESLKPMYDFFARSAARLHEVKLDAEDLAVTFIPE